MNNLWVQSILLILCSGMFYYVGYRLFSIFNAKLPIYILLVVSVILAIWCSFSIWYAWENTTLTVLWTFSARIFVLWFLLFIFLWILHIISIWYKINPWIILSVFAIILWVWVFFSLHTKITNLNIQSDKIEKDTKILLVSDVHVDYIFSKFHLKKIENIIKKERPDFVIIAWDLINRPHSDYLKTYSMIKNDWYNIPIYAIIWNHDVLWDTSIIQNLPGISSINLLNNESVIINWIQLVWIIDKSLWGNKDIDKILSESSMNKGSNLFTILATHQPIWLEKLQDYPIDLEVAWHTHRGQFYWMREVARLMNDYAYWEYKYWEKTAFVTQWIWTWGLPFRLWTQSEMVVINLTKK